MCPPQTIRVALDALVHVLTVHTCNNTLHSRAPLSGEQGRNKAVFDRHGYCRRRRKEPSCDSGGYARARCGTLGASRPRAAVGEGIPFFREMVSFLAGGLFDPRLLRCTGGPPGVGAPDACASIASLLPPFAPVGRVHAGPATSRWQRGLLSSCLVQTS